MKVRVFWRIIAMCIGFFSLTMTAIAGTLPSKRSITLAIIIKGPVTEKSRAILDSAYAKLGIKINYVEMPARRSLEQSNAGHLDGEIVRGKIIESSFPNLRRVDAPMMFFSKSAIVLKNNGEAPLNMLALSKMPSVGIIRGLQYDELATKGWPNVVVCNNHESAIKMLQAGRMSALLASTDEALLAIQTARLDSDDFKFQEFYKEPVFHYLHKDNEAILPLISAELHRLKNNHKTVLEGVIASGRVKFE